MAERRSRLTSGFVREALDRLALDGQARRLLRGGGGDFLVRGVGLGVAFLLQLLLARLLGVEDYGLFILAQSWIAMLALPSTLGMRETVLRFASIYLSGQDWSHLRGLWRFANGCVLAMSLFVGLSAFSASMGLKLSPAFRPVFLLGLGMLPLLAMLQLRSVFLRAMGRPVLAVLPESLVRPLLFGLAALVCFWVLGGLGAGQAMLANFVVWAATLLLTALLVKRLIPAGPLGAAPVTRAREWLAMALPSLFVTGMQLLLDRTDVIMLGALLGAREAGLYAAASRVALLIAFGLQAMNSVTGPELASRHAAGDRRGMRSALRLSSKVVAAYTLPAALLLTLCGDWILGLFGEAFREAGPALRLLILGQVVNALCGPTALAMAMTGRQRLAAWIFALTALGNVALNFLLIPRFGLQGAALATLTGVAVWNGIFVVILRRGSGVDPSLLSLTGRR